MELIYYPIPHRKKTLLMMVMLSLPPLVSSTVSATTAIAMMTRAVITKYPEDGA